MLVPSLLSRRLAASRRWSCRLWASSALASSSYLSLASFLSQSPLPFLAGATCDADTQKIQDTTLSWFVYLLTGPLLPILSHQSLGEKRQERNKDQRICGTSSALLFLSLPHLTPLHFDYASTGPVPICHFSSSPVLCFISFSTSQSCLSCRPIASSIPLSRILASLSASFPRCLCILTLTEYLHAVFFCLLLTSLL